RGEPRDRSLQRSTCEDVHTFDAGERHAPALVTGRPGPDADGPSNTEAVAGTDAGDLAQRHSELLVDDRGITDRAPNPVIPRRQRGDGHLTTGRQRSDERLVDDVPLDHAA